MNSSCCRWTEGFSALPRLRLSLLFPFALSALCVVSAYRASCSDPEVPATSVEAQATGESAGAPAPDDEQPAGAPSPGPATPAAGIAGALIEPGVARSDGGRPGGGHSLLASVEVACQRQLWSRRLARHAWRDGPSLVRQRCQRAHSQRGPPGV